MNSSCIYTTFVVVLTFTLITFNAPSTLAESIWIEGENPTTSNVSHHGWYDSVNKQGMSGNNWLSHYGNQPGHATWDFNATQPGDYTFWFRGNTTIASASYEMNGDGLRTMPFDDVRGSYMISERPDHRSLGWIKAGTVTLNAGTNTLHVRFDSNLSNHGGVDAIVFTNEGFIPSGAQQPQAAQPAGPSDWFPVVFDDDAFSPNSAIDISSLTPAPAGQFGHLQRDGKDLRFQNSDTPIKFFAVGANALTRQFTPDQQAQRIRYLKKHGINMVRQHTVLEEVGPMRNGRFDPQRLDGYDQYFAELKKQGVYTTWSVFSGLNIYPEDGYPQELYNELPDRAGGKNTYGIVNIERQLQDIQIKYLRELLNHVNPYTGLRYADDPALAVVEVHNEDTVFFHNPLSALHGGEDFPVHSKRLRQKFHQWVQQKYRNQAGVIRAWGSLRNDDNWRAGELGLMAAYHLGADGPLFEMAGQTARAADFIAFLTELQRDFYTRRESEIRSIGFKGVTVTTAWRSGGPAADPANLYADTAADMIDRHAYFGGGAGGHSVAAGEVNNGSHLGSPGTGLLALGLYQVEDRPFAVTEWTQLPPNEYKAEAAPLMAFYGMGLQGWDALYHFTSSRQRLGDGWPNLNSYVTDTPHYIGQFPALAFAIRNNHIAEADIIAARRLTTNELFTGKDPLGQSFDGYDVKELSQGSSTPAEALAIGRVTVSFDGGEAGQPPCFALFVARVAEYGVGLWASERDDPLAVVPCELAGL